MIYRVRNNSCYFLTRSFQRNLLLSRGSGSIRIFFSLLGSLQFIQLVNLFEFSIRVFRVYIYIIGICEKSIINCPPCLGRVPLIARFPLKSNSWQLSGNVSESILFSISLSVYHPSKKFIPKIPRIKFFLFDYLLPCLHPRRNSSVEKFKCSKIIKNYQMKRYGDGNWWGSQNFCP